jgi:formylglycine-generating enzyme required for sulfatase activity
MNREDYALTCIEPDVARAFCMFEGGDLPSEAQWEYAATAATPAVRRDYPWGDDAPSCERAVYGRTPLSGLPGACESFGKGPRSIAESINDKTPLGIVGMGGGVAELTRDGYAAYDEPCWIDAPIREPVCANYMQGRIARGGSWVTPPSPAMRSSARVGPAVEGKSFVGFRCVYSAR